MNALEEHILPFAGTEIINTDSVPLEKSSVDLVFLILSVHEIRRNAERILFFKQIKAALTENGKIIVVEHTIDGFNFTAYNFGFFHFLSRKTWLQNFKVAELILDCEIKITPFITVYSLTQNGNSP